MSDTLVVIKPDAVQRGLVGEVLRRIEQRGFKILLMELQSPTEARMQKLYEKFERLAFFEDLIAFMTSGPVIPMFVRGDDAVRRMRYLIGATHTPIPQPGSIRGDLAESERRNIIHASDSHQSMQREWHIFFPNSHVEEE